MEKRGTTEGIPNFSDNEYVMRAMCSIWIECYLKNEILLLPNSLEFYQVSSVQL